MRRVHDDSYAALLGLGLALLGGGCDVNRSSLGEGDDPASAMDAAIVHLKDAALPTMSTSPTSPTSPAMPTTQTSASPVTPTSPASPVTPMSPSSPQIPTQPMSPGLPAMPPDDASVDEPDEPDATVSTVDDAGVSCDLSGSFALRIDADATWAGTTLFNIVPIIKPGTGTLSVVLLADMQADHAVTLRACGAEVPDFASSVNETYGVAFPDEFWEKLALRWSVGFASTCADPGCALTFDPLIAQLGIGIPEHASWPTPRDKLDVATLRDEDGDGIPGVLLRCRGPKDPGPKKYSHPPTSYLLNARVSEIMIALRIGLTLQGKLDSCDRFGGGLPAMSVDTRALACQLDTGTRCAPEQLGFVDDDLPVWKIDNATFTAVRVPTGASCADVRATTLQ